MRGFPKVIRPEASLCFSPPPPLALTGFLLIATTHALPQNSVLQSASPSHESLHTAVYTRDLPVGTQCAGPNEQDTVATAVVSVLGPREVADWPENGVTVVGEAISTLFVEDETRTVSQDLTWTLSGNTDVARDAPQPTAPPLQPGEEALTSVYTSSTSFLITYVSDLAGREREEWFTTERVTYIETIGPDYPATIVRTGYTNIEAKYIAVETFEPVSTLETTDVFSFWRTTTMVQVGPQPTPVVVACGED
ncbi:unnamed protein product [Parascedosporium putredinis]|uniref:Uncharacterized protein n=1 Tax=Parascedosporium putredinis TaxID=1442378 RepID=A0A9P1H3B0_9PEZI|nr:unnamed protein product [Parascedosporium putredinis]CAI7994370.1 unnamed protein product [Parascedosporium putredinis]